MQCQPCTNCILAILKSLLNLKSPLVTEALVMSNSDKSFSLAVRRLLLGNKHLSPDVRIVMVQCVSACVLNSGSHDQHLEVYVERLLEQDVAGNACHLRHKYCTLIAVHTNLILNYNIIHNVMYLKQIAATLVVTVLKEKLEYCATQKKKIPHKMLRHYTRSVNS